jgi:hypothetical protein
MMGKCAQIGVNSGFWVRDWLRLWARRVKLREDLEGAIFCNLRFQAANEGGVKTAILTGVERRPGQINYPV